MSIPTTRHWVVVRFDNPKIPALMFGPFENHEKAKKWGNKNIKSGDAIPQKFKGKLYEWGPASIGLIRVDK